MLIHGFIREAFQVQECNRNETYGIFILHVNISIHFNLISKISNGSAYEIKFHNQKSLFLLEKVYHACEDVEIYTKP